MDAVQQRVREQRHWEALCGAAVRALTGEPALDVRARALYRGQARLALHAPHLSTPPTHDDPVGRRGIADGMALRWCLSDWQLHRARQPAAPVQRLVFELLEQLRVEALVPAHLPGMAQNLVRRFSDWSQAFHHAGLSDTALGNLLYTVAQVCWARLNARPVLEETADFIEATRAGIVPLIGHDLAALKRHLRDQAAYADAALSIARTVDALIGAADGTARDAVVTPPDDRRLRSRLRLLLDFEDSDAADSAAVTDGRRSPSQSGDDGYRVFTSRYDTEVDAATLVRPAMLGELRARLDQRVRAQRINVLRLARQLAAVFAEPARDGWTFGEEEGRIDGRRLAQLVSSPAERRLFRGEHWQPRPRAQVSLLIDCSGSMKAHIEPVAVFVDVFGRALSQAGVGVEVLGFTTGAWNGGRAQRDWLASGRPARPGRLNEARHIVYKDADSCWRTARPALAAMLKPDLFREGMDGEAVDWACGRMGRRAASRRILIVVSDGCPMDAATGLANDPLYLERHLQAVVARREREAEIEIIGLGVGLDLRRYYRRCLALDLSKGLTNSAVAETVALLAGRRDARR